MPTLYSVPPLLDEQKWILNKGKELTSFQPSKSILQPAHSDLSLVEDEPKTPQKPIIHSPSTSLSSYFLIREAFKSKSTPCHFMKASSFQLSRSQYFRLLLKSSDLSCWWSLLPEIEEAHNNHWHFTKKTTFNPFPLDPRPLLSLFEKWQLCLIMTQQQWNKLTSDTLSLIFQFPLEITFNFLFKIQASNFLSP